MKLTTAGRLVLSSERSVYKTEGFLRKTRKILSVDKLLLKITDAIYLSSLSFDDETYIAETDDKAYTLFFHVGRGIRGLNDKDIVFYKFLSREKSERTNDRQIINFLDKDKTFSFTVLPVKDDVKSEEFDKIYLLTNDDKVFFPLLDPEQKRILETEDNNVLVQGVAGSGKTNLCIEKVIYCACRGYRGRVLYTTYSRGLLLETRRRVTVVRDNIAAFLSEYERNEVVFLDKNHKKAIENFLGISFAFDGEEYIADVLKRIIAFLDKNVDYFLIEDLYAAKTGNKVRIADESTFLNEYILKEAGKSTGLLDKVKKLSFEIIYKEIFGLITGKCDLSDYAPMSREEYVEMRSDSFSRAEREAIYALSVDYGKFLASYGYCDNNSMSRDLLDKVSEGYSVGVIDETQDFTQVNLCLIKKLCRKMFCVGDALQMINPSYFSFAYLKRLMYGELTGVAELKHNYRNSEKIERIVESIGDLNVKRFGTHSFVLRGQSVGKDPDSSAVYVRDKSFVDSLGANRFENLTVIVSTQKKKELLRKKLRNIEILTVSEAKGLERNAVVTVDLLSDDIDKWEYLKKMSLNRKTADENSVFRYYFNLFYVGVSRAKRYLYVAEREDVDYFDEVIRGCFDIKTAPDALRSLSDVAGKTELDDDELIDRIDKFLELGQYNNAYFTADRLSDDTLMEKEKAKIYVHENYLKSGDYRGAGMEYWRRGMDEEAKSVFRMSGDEAVIPLIDACRHGGRNLDYDIVKFLPMVKDNEVAMGVILSTLKDDRDKILSTQKDIKSALKSQRSKK